MSNVNDEILKALDHNMYLYNQLTSHYPISENTTLIPIYCDLFERDAYYYPVMGSIFAVVAQVKEIKLELTTYQYSFALSEDQRYIGIAKFRCGYNSDYDVLVMQVKYKWVRR